MKTKLWGICGFLAITALAPGCGAGNGRQNQSTISVTGTGTVLVQPDMIQMSVTLSNVARTTKAAQEEVSKMVRQTLSILKDAHIEDKNISTASLRFRSEYEYGNRRVVIGQRAEQSITFSVNDINDGNERVSGIIDKLIQINGIELDRLDFGVKNNTEYFIKSRELAFQKAVEKANQYAGLSKLKIIKVLSISEEGNQQVLAISNRAAVNQLNFAEAARDDGSTLVPTGELEITTRISVSFLLE